MLITVLIITILISIIFILKGIYSPNYKGEISDHFNGTEFYSPYNKSEVKGIKFLLKWILHREKGVWNKVSNLESVLKRNYINSLGDLDIVFINHSTFIIRIDGITIITDPVFDKCVGLFGIYGPKRMQPTGLKINELMKVDLVLISHNHYDHLDIISLKKIFRIYSPKILTPLGVGNYLKMNNINNYYDLDWWDETEVNSEISIVCVPANHFSGRGLTDRNKTLWCGYIIKSKYGLVYFVGDTGYDEKLFKEIGKKFGDISLSLIPIGAFKPEWFMSPVHVSPEQAIKIHFDVKSIKSIAMHWGTFQLADDGMYEPKTLLDSLTDEMGIENFIALKNGESIKIR
jgi:L-ascorbate metabolism protein UlaG (beta-lactamase superfamily)